METFVGHIALFLGKNFVNKNVSKVGVLQRKKIQSKKSNLIYLFLILKL